MTTDHSQSDLLDELLLQWEEASEQGRDVPVEELCRDCSDLIPLLKQRVEALKRLNWLNINDDSGDQPDALDDEELPETLGRFLIEAKVGSGGFAQVWRAFDPELHRTVAIKIPHRERLLSAGAAASFLEEARRLAKLKHRSIAQVYDVGRDGSRCFLVCEYVDGGDLRQKLKIQRPTWRQSVEIICEVADALQFAHEHGFIHRDIKPENILLDSDGRPVLADFGIAMMVDDVERAEEATSGTLRYMSPEQFNGDPATKQSDVFSLGIVFYELLTGLHPFDSESANRTGNRPTFEKPTKPCSLNDKVPFTVAQACLNCLSIQPVDRVSSAAELSTKLKSCLHESKSRISIIAAVLIGIVVLFAVVFLASGDNITDSPPKTTTRPLASDTELEFHHEVVRRIIARGGNVIIRHHATPIREPSQFSEIDGPIVTVNLKDQPVDDSVLSDVAGIQTLLDLNLTNTDITDDGLPKLRDLVGLRELRLNNTSLTDAGLMNLPDFPSLRRLELRSTKITDAGLTNIRRFPTLQTVVLTDTAVTDDGVPHLLHSPALRSLQLNDTQISDESIPSLASLKGLEVLGVRGTRISADGLKQLRAALTRTDVIPMGNAKSASDGTD